MDRNAKHGGPVAVVGLGMTVVGLAAFAQDVKHPNPGDYLIVLGFCIVLVGLFMLLRSWVDDARFLGRTIAESAWFDSVAAAVDLLSQYIPRITIGVAFRRDDRSSDALHSTPSHAIDAQSVPDDWVTSDVFNGSESPRPLRGITAMPIDKEFRQSAFLDVRNWGGEAEFQASITVRAMSGERIAFWCNQPSEINASFSPYWYRDDVKLENRIRLGSGGDEAMLEIARCNGVRSIDLWQASKNVRIVSVEWDNETTPARVELHVGIHRWAADGNPRSESAGVWIVEGGPEGLIRVRPRKGA